MRMKSSFENVLLKMLASCSFPRRKLLYSCVTAAHMNTIPCVACDLVTRSAPRHTIGSAIIPLLISKVGPLSLTLHL